MLYSGETTSKEIQPMAIDTIPLTPRGPGFSYISFLSYLILPSPVLSQRPLMMATTHTCSPAHPHSPQGPYQVVHQEPFASKLNLETLESK